MKLYGKARQRARYRHWETWAALVALAACAWLGAYLGSKYFGHPWPLMVVGVVVGGFISRRANRYVDQQYHQ